MLQRIVPGSGYIDETGARQALVPGVGYVHETGTVPPVTIGTLTTAPLKNNTLTVQGSLTGLVVHVFTLAGALALSKTSQTTDSAGVWTVTDAALTIGATYILVVLSPVSGAHGSAKLAAT